MALGGFAPLPLRLIADELRGLSAAQHARLCASLTATVKTCPFAIITFNTDGTAFQSYLAMHGEGEFVSPTIANISTGIATVEWEDDYEDDYENRRGVVLRHAMVTAHGAVAIFPVADLETATRVRVRSTRVSSDTVIDAVVTLVVW